MSSFFWDRCVLGLGPDFSFSFQRMKSFVANSPPWDSSVSIHVLASLSFQLKSPRWLHLMKPFSYSSQRARIAESLAHRISVAASRTEIEICPLLVPLKRFLSAT